MLAVGGALQATLVQAALVAHPILLAAPRQVVVAAAVVVILVAAPVRAAAEWVSTESGQTEQAVQEVSIHPAEMAASSTAQLLTAPAGAIMVSRAALALVASCGVLAAPSPPLLDPPAALADLIRLVAALQE